MYMKGGLVDVCEGWSKAVPLWWAAGQGDPIDAYVNQNKALGRWSDTAQWWFLFGWGSILGENNAILK